MGILKCKHDRGYTLALHLRRFTATPVLRTQNDKQRAAANGTRAVLYVRISTLEQLKGVSLEAQEEKLRGYCQMSGLEVVPDDVIREEGVSASVPLNKRPGGAE